MKDQHTPVMQSQNVKENGIIKDKRVSPKMTLITNRVNACARDNLSCLPFDNMYVRSSANLWLIVFAVLGPTLMKQSNAAKTSVSHWIKDAIVNNGVELAVLMIGVSGNDLNCMMDPCIMRSKDAICTEVATRGLNDLRVQLMRPC